MFRRRSRWWPTEAPLVMEAIWKLGSGWGGRLHAFPTMSKSRDRDRSCLVGCAPQDRNKISKQRVKMMPMRDSSYGGKKIRLGRCRCLEKVDKIGVAGGTVPLWRKRAKPIGEAYRGATKAEALPPPPPFRHQQQRCSHP